MSFWRNLFGKNNQNSGKSDSHFDAYRAELNALGLTRVEDLEELVRPLITTATKIEVQAASIPSENSQLRSQFGGQPYFEAGEEWPTTKRGEHLDFIFQVFNTRELELPDSIRLVQFYYRWKGFALETVDDGWLVKIYEQIDRENSLLLKRPSELEQTPYCEISFSSIKSLPDWEGIEIHDENASKLSCVLDEDEPWDSYDQVVAKLIGEQGYHSQIGGYPKWVQGESTPTSNRGVSMKLLFQIESEDNANLMWGDVGLIYVFYEEETGRIEFTLQCH